MAAGTEWAGHTLARHVLNKEVDTGGGEVSRDPVMPDAVMMHAVDTADQNEQKHELVITHLWLIVS